MDLKHLEVINKGRSAEVGYDQLRPFLDEAKSDLITQMCQVYRNPDTRGNGHFYMSLVASYCSLEDLESKMKRAITAKNTVFERNQPQL